MDALSDPKRSDKVAGKPFFVTNHESRPFWAFLGDICEGLGYPRPYIGLPFLLIISVAMLFEYVIRPLVSPFKTLNTDFTVQRCVAFATVCVRVRACVRACMRAVRSSAAPYCVYRAVMCAMTYQCVRCHARCVCRMLIASCERTFDPERAITLLGYRPKVSIDTALKRTLATFENLRNPNAPLVDKAK